MSSSIVLAAAALGASLFLVGTTRARAFAITAAVVSGIALAVALHVVRIGLPHVDLVLWSSIAALGVLLILRVDAKAKVVAATVVAAVGIQALAHQLF